MHCLEHILLMASVAVERDEISKAELVRSLRFLASESHDYSNPYGKESVEIVKMNEDWLRRFEHLMHGSSADG
jgi:hypothetical protein